ncbi:hypothetical protein M2349_000292 [Caldanaerobacter subterraneus subsp. tengcongensis MB4]|uniref:Uncharacterized protein n=1 Tax=Caldanaerobacter subterraneus subsp. tengcongensis (strain DSM 15242 / JCM 11007 / NBRC 100824 / MB4) TaxID=273068 RepID=Q8R8C6_CALS4|nr:hypothetical protein [Caldanaerobacter subterraneus]AAM25253.1 hypothetical protein TTE2080 [Caldanaerobacter subterraneus subsp. tengcongensis MB4]MCS3915151.1 hypothetical protein [Caldanaerobacter subterraneus subsp. tengcongensis MB4]
MFSLQAVKKQVTELSSLLEKEANLEYQAALRFAEYRYRNYVPLPPNLIPALSKIVKNVLAESDDIIFLNKFEFANSVIENINSMSKNSKLKQELKNNPDSIMQSIDLLLERQIAVIKVKQGQAETKELQKAVALFLITTYSEKAVYVLGRENNLELTPKEIAEKVLELLKCEENIPDDELKKIAL